MEKYLTEQRKRLFAFLQSQPDKKFTARQIADALQKSGVSQSAVYRNLSKLADEGLVERSIQEGNRQISFQYIAHRECSECIHLECTKCGRIFHMDSAAAQQMINSLLHADEFCIDKKKTVLYGACKSCEQEQEGGNHD